VKDIRHKIYQFDGWTIDYDFLTCEKEGKTVSLKLREMEVLILLLTRRMLYRDELIIAAWGRADVTNHSLTVTISELRRKLKTKSIKVINQRGYYVDQRLLIEE